MRIVIFGPQGSGKGTQAKFLAEKLNIPHISTGVIFRDEMQRNTDLGRSIFHYMKNYQLVPDEITNKLIENRISEENAKKGFVLDGYPRTIEQVNFLDSLSNIEAAIEIVMDDKEALRRLSGRRTCICGQTYHLIYNPPEKNGICGSCGKNLFIREDDMPERIKKRLIIYREKIIPIREYYQNKNILILIDGYPSIQKVRENIFHALNIF